MALTKVTLDMIDMDLIIDTIVPAGVLWGWGGSSLPGGKWLWADGSVVSRTGDYAELFGRIGTTFGAGDGTTTFNLPDYRGRVMAGADDMGGIAAGRLTGGVLGAVMGVESVTLTAAQSGLPGHTHTATSEHNLATSSAGAHVHTSSEVTATVGDGVAVDATTGLTSAAVNTSSAGAHTHPITGGVTTTVTAVTAAPASASHTNVQPTQICNVIIKY